MHDAFEGGGEDVVDHWACSLAPWQWILALVGVAYALVFFCALGLFGLLRYADTKRTLGPPPPDAVKIRAKQVGSCSVVVWLALSLAIIVFVNFFHFFNQCEGALRTVSGL